jgi:hypothetical protein
VATPPETDASVVPSVLALEKLNGGQKMMLAVLLPILAFFAFDAFMLIRRKKIVVRGHSLVHASVIALVVLVVITTNFGVMR